MRSCRLSSTPILALLLLLLAPARGGEAGEPDTLRPGGVVRWPGAGVERCVLAGRTWPAHEDGCWYAIDLLHPAGSLELGRWRGGELETRRVVVAGYAYAEERITLEDDTQVHLSAADLKRVGGEQEKVAELWRRPDGGRLLLPLDPPLAELPAGSRFGLRRFFNGEPRSPHSGTDYPAPEGTPVRAVADGEVALAADLFFSGSSVFIDHGDGLISMYFHLSRIDCATGQRVGRGEAIGQVGQTGRATGPHLHFGLRWRGARVDPALLLGGIEDVPAVP